MSGMHASSMPSTPSINTNIGKSRFKRLSVSNTAESISDTHSLVLRRAVHGNQKPNKLTVINGNSRHSSRDEGERMHRPRYDTAYFEEADNDGDVYTGLRTQNIVYHIIKINKWGTRKERSMIVHKGDQIIRLFDDKRRCHSEYPLRIMATLDIFNSTTIEVVFTTDQKPTRFVFRSLMDMSHFVEQLRTISSTIMVNDRRLGNIKQATIKSKTPRMIRYSVHKPRDGVHSAPNHFHFNSENSLILDSNGFHENGSSDYASTDINVNVLTFSVLRLVRSARKNKREQMCVTWRQHRRVLYLDLEGKKVRMLTIGLHIKDFRFEDIILLEKSYINVNQLHMQCKGKKNGRAKEYWYEFVSAEARAEFVGKLLGALPGTMQQRYSCDIKEKKHTMLIHSNSNDSVDEVDCNGVVSGGVSPFLGRRGSSGDANIAYRAKKLFAAAVRGKSASIFFEPNRKSIAACAKISSDSEDDGAVFALNSNTHGSISHVITNNKQSLHKNLLTDKSFEENPGYLRARTVKIGKKVRVIADEKVMDVGFSKKRSANLSKQLLAHNQSSGGYKTIRMTEDPCLVFCV